MSIEMLEKENSRRRGQEARERAFEERENQEEKEMDEQAKAAASMERADFLVKEVKQGRQQIKNIMVHMQQVLQAIASLRSQLQMSAQNDDPQSVAQDKQQLVRLQEKISGYKAELLQMKDELINVQVEQIREGKGASLSDQQLRSQAEELVQQIMVEVEKD